MPRQPTTFSVVKHISCSHRTFHHLNIILFTRLTAQSRTTGGTHRAGYGLFTKLTAERHSTTSDLALPGRHRCADGVRQRPASAQSQIPLSLHLGLFRLGFAPSPMNQSCRWTAVSWVFWPMPPPPWPDSTRGCHLRRPASPRDESTQKRYCWPLRVTYFKWRQV